MKPLDGKVALITGSGRGLGAAMAKCFAEAGAKVVINYLNQQLSAEATLQSIHHSGGTATIVQADVRDPEAVEALIQQTIVTYGGLDILVNNAHTPFQPKSFAELHLQDLRQQFQGTVESAFHCIQCALPFLQDSISRTHSLANIVNISSITVRQAEAGFGHRSAAKTYLEALTLLTLASELREKGIRVNVLRPDWCSTDQVKAFPEVYLQQKARENPMGRLTTPEEVAAAVLSLLTSTADETGMVFELDAQAHPIPVPLPL